MEWVLWISFFTIYVVCLFTVCALTFRKGHTVLGIVGIFFPFLWLLGAVIPAKPGSVFDLQERAGAPYRVGIQKKGGGGEALRPAARVPGAERLLRREARRSKLWLLPCRRRCGDGPHVARRFCFYLPFPRRHRPRVDPRYS